MSKVKEDRGMQRFMVDGSVKYVRELLLDCGCCLQIDQKDIALAINPRLLLELRVSAHKCNLPTVPQALGTCLLTAHSIRPHIKLPDCVAWREQPKQLPERFSATSENPIIVVHEPPKQEVGAVYKGPHDPDEHIAWLEQRIAYLERELAGAEDRHAKLNNIYNKLADQWNAFQATARPDNRNCQRAEAAGELSRKLAEVFLALAYGKQITEQETKLLSDVLWRASGEAP